MVWMHALVYLAAQMCQFHCQGTHLLMQAQVPLKLVANQKAVNPLLGPTLLMIIQGHSKPTSLMLLRLVMPYLVVLKVRSLQQNGSLVCAQT